MRFSGNNELTPIILGNNELTPIILRFSGNNELTPIILSFMYTQMRIVGLAASLFPSASETNPDVSFWDSLIAQRTAGCELSRAMLHHNLAPDGVYSFDLRAVMISSSSAISSLGRL